MYWVVNKDVNEKQIQAAKDFLNWMYMSDIGKDYMTNKFDFIPAYEGYDSEKYQPKDPLSKDVLRYSQEGRTIPWVFPGYPSGWGNNVIGLYFQNYINGQMEWDDMINKSKESWAKLRK